MYSKEDLENLNLTEPYEILLETFSHIPPEDLWDIAKTNKKFHQLATDEKLWEKKFAQHFPDKLEEAQDSSWYKNFQRVYKEEYKDLTPTIKKLFSLVKEGDPKLVKDKNLEQYISQVKHYYLNKAATSKWQQTFNTQQHPEWIKPLAECIQKNGQFILNHFYKSIFENKTNTDGSIDVLKKDATRNYTILHYAAMFNQSSKEIARLISLGADVNAESGEDGTPLHIAAEMGQQEAVNALLSNGADINVSHPKSGDTPIFLAARNNQVNVVRTLLENGATIPPQISKNKQTPLYIAQSEGNEEIVSMLLAAMDKLKITIDGEDANLLFLKAIEHGNSTLIPTYLKLGVSVNIRDKNNDTPLHIAVKNKDIKTIKLLLEHHADRNLLGAENCTPLQIAKMFKHEEMITLLTPPKS